MIAVVIPTIPGREALYERTREAYRRTAGVTLITVRGRSTIGRAWNDGAQAARDTGAEYLHLSADDVEPSPGWALACIEAVDEGLWPSPRILNPDGSLHSCGTMGGGMLMPDCADRTACVASPFPFMRMRTWDAIGPSLAIHYYADDFLAWRARQIGLDVAVCRGFELLHLEGLAGRAKVAARSMRDRAEFLGAIGVESPAREAVHA